MKRLRYIIIALVAAAGFAIAAPSTADAGGKSFIVNAHKHQHGPVKIARKIERLHYRTKELRQIWDPYERDYEIDRLQSRLKKLKRSTSKYRGKQVRRNLHHINRLQTRLRQAEKHNNKRIRKVRAERQREFRRDARRDRRAESRRYNRDDSYRDPVTQRRVNTARNYDLNGRPIPNRYNRWDR